MNPSWEGFLTSL